MSVAFYVAVAATLAFGVLRFIVPVSGAVNPDDVFKDLAHVWVGILFGIAGAKSDSAYKTVPKDYLLWEKAALSFAGAFWWWMLAVGITVVEIIAFFVR